jgi:hypothetical protein
MVGMEQEGKQEGVPEVVELVGVGVPVEEFY